MNARKIWTELFQKPAGRLVLFLLVGGIFLAFILMRRGPQPKPDNTPVASQATRAKSYSFKEDIQPLTRTEATPSPREPERVAARATPTPKPPPPIPQTIFATKEQSLSEYFLPYGRLLRCELVNTVDSTNIDTPIIGLVIEDAWNDGRVIIPAGTEVHGVAQKSPVRERIGSDQQWFLVFQDGRELPISGTVLDYAPKNPDSWAESDGSAGLRGFIVKSDKYAEAKAILAAMISAGAGAFPETTTLLSPLGSATQAQRWRNRQRLFRGAASRRSALLASVFWSGSTRTLSTSAFPRARRSTSTSRRRSIWAKPPSVSPHRFHRQAARLSHEILSHDYSSLLFSPVAPRGRMSSQFAQKCPAPRSRRQTCRKSARQRR